MKTRYTYDQLEKELKTLNESLGKLACPYVLTLGNAYNQTELYEATPDQASKFSSNKRIETGTPRDCRLAAYEYVAQKVRYNPPLNTK